mgnify:CR=1 FL=1
MQIILEETTYQGWTVWSKQSDNIVWVCGMEWGLLSASEQRFREGGELQVLGSRFYFFLGGWGGNLDTETIIYHNWAVKILFFEQ